ncbi:MAG: SpoIID/LytB domain-containing protein [Candidatus Riflebacteria bacterium]|nr:SpoIID/LytB domain-containing protein [Candidatus Riflebacteria bacterium]
MISAIDALKTLFASIICLFVFAVPANALNDQLLRIGLMRFGFPTTFMIEPSGGIIDISDPIKNVLIYRGSARRLLVQSSNGMLRVLVDGTEQTTSDHTLLFSPVSPSPRYIILSSGFRSREMYRGSIGIVPGTGRLLAINVVPMEDYLLAVVPSEIGTLAPPASLEAQAIGARSYALRNLDRHGIAGFDLCDGQHCQAYGGMTREFAGGNEAVAHTTGQVLFYDGKPANTVYHAHCGGRLSACNEVWGGVIVPYLPKHPDRLGENPAFCSWNDNRSKGSTISGRVVAPPLKSVKTGSSSRVALLSDEQYNSKSSDHILFFRGNAPPISLPSPGMVRGHRVGLCQDGAIGMGRAGFDTASILAFYYPGTRLMHLSMPAQPSEEIKVKVTPGYQIKTQTVVATSVNQQSSHNDPSGKKAHRKALPSFRKWFWSNISPVTTVKLASGEHFRSSHNKFVDHKHALIETAEARNRKISGSKSGKGKNAKKEKHSHSDKQVDDTINN